MEFGEEPTKNSQTKRWCATWNNYSMTDIVYVSEYAEAHCDYFVCGFEYCPTTGTPHLQIYFLFKENHRFNKMKKLFPRCNFRVAKGNSKQNQAYCTKEGNFVEIGEPPMTPAEQVKADWTNTLKEAKAGNFDNINPQHYVCHLSNIHKIYERNSPVPATLPHESVAGLWVFGTTGMRKSSQIREMYPNAYVKNCNHKWWPRYKNEEVVFFEDLNPENAKLHDWKIIADRFPFDAETKGGHIFIRPKIIIVSSNHPLGGCFHHLLPVDVEAIKRRFHVFHKTIVDELIPNYF